MVACLCGLVGWKHAYNVVRERSVAVKRRKFVSFLVVRVFFCGAGVGVGAGVGGGLASFDIFGQGEGAWEWKLCEKGK